MPNRFSPMWHRGEATTFQRFIGVSHASPVNHQDPIHQERIARYDRNIAYYQEAQYEQENLRALEARDFLALRVNYTSVITRSTETKADWLYGKPIDVNIIPLDTDGNPVVQTDEQKKSPKGAPKKVKDRVTQIRKHNHMVFWDWVMAVMGLVCGDFFILVDAGADDEHPTISLQDPSFVFPDYPDKAELPMRACQIQYNVDREGESVDDEGLTTMRITEDYRLEIVGESGVDDYEELEILDSEQLEERTKALLAGDTAGAKLTCMYRRFEDDKLVDGSKRDIGVPVIPIIHGRNSYIWNTRYGTDEINSLIPKTEKFNEMFYYAERVGRINAHARLFFSGVRRDDEPLRSDFDDVIYGGEKSSAQVLSLSTDTAVLEFVTNQLEQELHRRASLPVIAEGDPEGFGSAPSGLSLIIKFGPLQSVTSRHHTTYGDTMDAIYTLALLFDEMVIQGKGFGSVYKYDEWIFDWGWYDAMPQSREDVIADATTATGGKQLVSSRTARSWVPGVDPDREAELIKQEMAEASQQSLDSAPAGGGNGLGGQGGLLDSLTGGGSGGT